MAAEQGFQQQHAALPPLEGRRHPQRGRGLWTTRHVRGGETLLCEAPILLSVASDKHAIACASCLRMPQGAPMLACPGCGGQASFCSAACADVAGRTPWVHGPAVCSAFKALRHWADAAGGQDVEQQDVDAGRFLAQALALKAAALAGSGDAAVRLEALQALQGAATEVEQCLVGKLAPVLAHAWPAGHGPGGTPAALPLTAQEMADLLRKEQYNSYGIPVPPCYNEPASSSGGGAAAAAGGEEDGEDEEEECARPLRGSALYSVCSLVNHECNPNVARFDGFDAPGPLNTLMVFRAMHDLPPGTEVFQSYCLVSWDYEDRQEQCQSVYGFTCTCQRCKLEQGWSLAAHGQQQPNGHHRAAGGGDGMEEDGSSGEWETDDEAHEAHADAAGPAQEQQDMELGTSPGAGAGTAPLAAAAAAATSSLGGVAVLTPGGVPPALSPLAWRSWPLQAEQADPGPLDATYLQLFLLKHVCPVGGCLGLLAPQAAGAKTLQCNVCGALRSEADFLAELDS